MATIPFEYLLLALETTRGTAVNPPTHYLNLAGTLTPRQSRYRPDESRGHLARNTRSRTVRRWCEFEGEGGLDTRNAVILGHMLFDGVVSPTTPGGTTPRLWTFTPTLTTDDIDSATLYWGDPNVQAFQAAYCMLDEVTITADASGEDGVMVEASGMGRFPSATAPSSVPAQLNPPLLAPSDMQLWIDTASAIGTSEITGGRFVSCNLTIPTGVTRKWSASGPSGGRQFQRTGRTKRAITLEIVMELLDLTQYTIYANNEGDTVARVRVRFNGPIIETTYRHFIEFDLWGPLEVSDWGELEESNRTIVFTLESEYDTTAGTDIIMRVQNDSATI
jgi:hypothetical protein